MDSMSPGLGPGVVVSTFLPISTFAYGNATVDITGTIDLELTGSPAARKLQAQAVNANSVGTGAETVSFDIKVGLQQNVESTKDPVVSAGMFASNGLGGLVLVFFLVHVIMW